MRSQIQTRKHGHTSDRQLTIRSRCFGSQTRNTFRQHGWRASSDVMSVGNATLQSLKKQSPAIFRSRSAIHQLPESASALVKFKLHQHAMPGGRCPTLQSISFQLRTCARPPRATAKGEIRAPVHFKLHQRRHAWRLARHCSCAQLQLPQYIAQLLSASTVPTAGSPYSSYSRLSPPPWPATPCLSAVA
jgi:hypothetical protein